MTIDEMRNKLTEYCYGFIHCENGCRLRKPGGFCRWNDLSDESTEDCYHFLIAEGLIGKPEQPEINFVKVERNDAVEPTNDAVQHPSHYTQGGIECIDAIRASMTADGFTDYCKGNIIKYIWRWRDKGGVEDLRKASVYLDWLINAADEKENDYVKETNFV